MSQSISHPALTNPAKPDATPQKMAIVLTEKRIVRHMGMEYHIPAGSVIGTRMLPASTTFRVGHDAKLIVAGTLVAGDTTEA